MSTNDGPDVGELKHMVMSFRVSELQILLHSAGRNKSGRKHDLMSRALQLIKNDCSAQIQQRVMELYHRRFPRSKATQMINNSYPKETYRQMDYGGPVKNKEPDPDRSSRPPVHPNVTFKSLPFYEVLSDVIKPFSLAPSPGKSYNSVEMPFTLSEDQVQKICNSSAKENFRKFSNTYQVQVQLRLCLLETTCEQNDLLPASLCVKVNHKTAQLPAYIPPSKAGVDPKRAPRPIDITSLCRLCHVSYNNVEITWSTEPFKNFAACINVVRQQTSVMLMQRLRRKGVRNSAHSTALVKEKLQRDPDSEIATTSLKVSLLCPLGKMRMKTPARPLTCTHLQCFDAMLFLQMNERKPTWICPVCDKPAIFSNLFIDGLFVEILSETSSEEIVFYENGDWKPFSPDKESYSLCTPTKSIALDLSGSPSDQSRGKQSKAKEPEIIDLTCDSSDEETLSPPAKNPMQKPPPQMGAADREREEIHSLSSSISPYRSDSSSAAVPEDKHTPPKKLPDFLNVDFSRTKHHDSGSADLYGTPTAGSPRPGSYNSQEAPISRSPHLNLGLSSGFPISRSRDNTPPLFHPSIMGFPSQYDFGQSPLDLSTLASFNHLLNDPRRIAGDRSSRSSPYLLGQTPGHHYPPSSHPSSEHVSSRTFYPTPFHPYPPMSYLPPNDNPSPLDVIPID